MNPPRFCLGKYLLLILLLGGQPLAATSLEPVAIITDRSGMPGDSIQDGAAELAVLMQLAQLKNRTLAPLGVVGIGNRHGVFSPGTHRALELAVHHGIPVVRLAQQGGPTAEASSSCLFVDGGPLPPAEASALLNRCLAQFGPLPTDPTSTAWQAQYARYQDAFKRATAGVNQEG